MKLKFTDHAQYRIRERKISIEDIKSVVRSPDFSKNSADGYIESRKKIESKVLEVIYKKEGNVILVITSYHL